MHCSPFTKASVFPLDLFASCSTLAPWSTLPLSLLAPAHNLVCSSISLVDRVNFSLFDQVNPTCSRFENCSSISFYFTCPQCTPVPASCICKHKFLDFVAPCGTLLLARTLGHICTCVDSLAICLGLSRHMLPHGTGLKAHNLPCNTLATGPGPACKHTCNNKNKQSKEVTIPIIVFTASRGFKIFSQTFIREYFRLQDRINQKKGKDTKTHT